MPLNSQLLEWNGPFRLAQGLLFCYGYWKSMLFLGHVSTINCYLVLNGHCSCFFLYLVNNYGGSYIEKLPINSLLAILSSLLVSTRIWFTLCSDFEVDYESEKKASIVYNALAVDKEVLLNNVNLHNVIQIVDLFELFLI